MKIHKNANKYNKGGGSVCFLPFTQGWWLRVEWVQPSTNIFGAPIECSACQWHVGDTSENADRVALYLCSSPVTLLRALAPRITSISSPMGRGEMPHPVLPTLHGGSQLKAVWIQACSVWLVRPTCCPRCVSASHSVSLRDTQGVERMSMHINKSYNTKWYKMGTECETQTVWRLWEFMVGTWHTYGKWGLIWVLKASSHHGLQGNG